VLSFCFVWYCVVVSCVVCVTTNQMELEAKRKAAAAAASDLASIEAKVTEVTTKCVVAPPVFPCMTIQTPADTRTSTAVFFWCCQSCGSCLSNDMCALRCTGRYDRQLSRLERKRLEAESEASECDAEAAAIQDEEDTYLQSVQEVRGIVASRAGLAWVGLG